MNSVFRKIISLKSNNLKIKKENAITLIALVITIIVLLILAGVTITTLTGENGLLSKAQLAKESNDYATEDEKDKLEVYEEFLNLDFRDRQAKTSKLINNYRIKSEGVSGVTITLNLDGEISTTDESPIIGYIIVVNGEGKDVTNKLPCTIKLPRNNTYNIQMIAVDKDINFKTSSNTVEETIPNMVITPLDYPTLTEKGMINVKYTNPEDPTDFIYGLDLNYDCTAADALDKKAFDDDVESYVERSSGKVKFYIEPNVRVWGINCLSPSTPYWTVTGGYWGGSDWSKNNSTGYYYVSYRGKDGKWNYTISVNWNSGPDKIYDIKWIEP